MKSLALIFLGFCLAYVYFLVFSFDWLNDHIGLPLHEYIIVTEQRLKENYK